MNERIYYGINEFFMEIILRNERIFMNLKKKEISID